MLFAKRDEYTALWEEWKDVKAYLLKTEVKDIVFESGRCLPMRKARGGHRMVHQLEPISSLTYTALAHMIAEAVEAARQPADIVFSYRVSLSDNGGSIWVCENDVST